MAERKKTGKYIKGALTSSNKKNQALTRTRHKNARKQRNAR